MYSVSQNNWYFFLAACKLEASADRKIILSWAVSPPTHPPTPRVLSTSEKFSWINSEKSWKDLSYSNFYKATFCVESCLK